MLKSLCTALVVMGVAASPAAAHVVLTDPEAVPGATYAGLFRIGHGCGESPTISVRIEIPPNVTALSGEPEQGWTMNVTRKGERISAVTWSGGVLPNKVLAHFGILMRLPENTGTLYFPTVQTCQTGENRWTNIPVKGTSWHDTPHPAPVLSVVPRNTNPNATAPAAPSGGEEHHHH